MAGRFASANRAVIHRAVAKGAKLEEVAAVENHHNFAWRETVRDPSGNDVQAIVHRKGATPAGNGVLGVIPGSMGDSGFVVRSRGVAESLNSAAHGAGRAMGRRTTIASIAKADRDRNLQARGVTLLGGGSMKRPRRTSASNPSLRLKRNSWRSWERLLRVSFAWPASRETGNSTGEGRSAPSPLLYPHLFAQAAALQVGRMRRKDVLEGL
jgi:hypothetical protein